MEQFPGICHSEKLTGYNTNTDIHAKSYQKRDPCKVLEAQEKEKKRKYLDSCLEQRRHFTPFVVSTDGPIGKEARNLHQTPLFQTCRQMAKDILVCMRVCKRQGEHCHHPCNTSVFTWQPHPCQQNQHQTPTMGRWCWSGTLLQLNHTRDSQITLLRGYTIHKHTRQITSWSHSICQTDRNCHSQEGDLSIHKNNSQLAIASTRATSDSPNRSNSAITCHC